MSCAASRDAFLASELRRNVSAIASFNADSINGPRKSTLCSVETEFWRSAFAIVTQELQDRVLCEIDRSFQRQGWTVPSLIFDGLHVEHREGVDLDAAMRVVEGDVLEATGYHVLLLEKPLYGLQDAPFVGE